MNASPETPPAKTGLVRLLLIIANMAASSMISLDGTIANVALPHIQAGFHARSDQIAWVLTAYIVAVALATPLTGWLTGRLGRKRTFAVALVGFTAASMLCGTAQGLMPLVGFRFLQGVFGAPIMPLSQTVMLDLYPRQRHGQAMALWGMGTVLGPVAGPIIGGFLTDALSWRWVFFINLPIGVLAMAGLMVLLPAEAKRPAKPFQFLGFAAIVLIVGALQLIVDRGPGQGWFGSNEIRAYLACVAIGLLVFAGHMRKARHPFFDRGLVADRNFVLATVLGFMTTMLLLSTVALLPSMMQNAMGRTALQAGTAMVPRGFGVLTAMFVTGRLVGRFDHRLVLLLGLCLTGFANWRMSRFGLRVGDAPIMAAGFVHGLGLGVIFVPMSAIAFSTIADGLRPEAATLNAIVRNAGGSIGISTMQALLVANTHRALAAQAPGRPDLLHSAMMVGYQQDFTVMIWIVAACAGVLLLMRPAVRAA